MPLAAVSRCISVIGKRSTDALKSARWRRAIEAWAAGPIDQSL
jgi:hypothetical protein